MLKKSSLITLVFDNYCTRVVSTGGEKKIGTHNFVNWGSHSEVYPCTYFTAAAAIGMKKEEIDTYIKKLDKVFTKFKLSKTNET